MKVGDKVTFKKKLRWILVKKCRSAYGVEYWKYRVERKYYGVWLSYTKQSYQIFPHRWRNLRRALNKDSNVHYTQLGWA